MNIHLDTIETPYLHTGTQYILQWQEKDLFKLYHNQDQPKFDKMIYNNNDHEIGII